MEWAAWFILVPMVSWLIYIWLLYPVIYRTKHPVPRVPLLPPTPDLRMDPEPFKRKRLERRREHQVWDKQFNPPPAVLTPRPSVDTDIHLGQGKKLIQDFRTKKCDHGPRLVCYRCERNY